ncbi:hypothetical protein RP20_CCG000967 [Aedes albopictus]|nr:hypothetical protein RP20_CCG000967 [Aedes albopictus]
MASIEDLLADLPIPQSALEVFAECGIDAAALICWPRHQIFDSLAQADVEWNSDKIWSGISSWRSRNGLEGAVILDDLHENRLDVEVNAGREIEETPEDPEIEQQQRETEKIPEEPVNLKSAGTEATKEPVKSSETKLQQTKDIPEPVEINDSKVKEVLKPRASKYRRTEKVPEPKEPVQINDRKAKAPLKARESKKRRTEKVEVEEPVRIIDLKSERTKKTPDEPEKIAEPEETAEKASKILNYLYICANILPWPSSQGLTSEPNQSTTKSPEAKAPLKAREPKKPRTEKVEVEEPVRIIDLKSEGTRKTPDEPEKIAEPDDQEVECIANSLTKVGMFRWA